MKPIKVFYSPITGTFWASQYYKVDGKTTIITGKKYDVTQDIAAAIDVHNIEFTKEQK